MRNRLLAIIAGAAIAMVALTPDPASAQWRFGGGWRGGAIGWRGAGWGWRGGAIGWRGAGWGWRRGWGWAPGLGWGAAAVGAGLVASSYPYGYYPAAYPYGYGYGAYGGCGVQTRLVWTGWGYQPILTQVCY